MGFLFIFSRHGLALVLDEQQVRNDGIGDQEPLGGQVPPAVQGLIGKAVHAALFQRRFQGRKGQQILLFVLAALNAHGGPQPGGQVLPGPLPGGICWMSARMDPPVFMAEI